MSETTITKKSPVKPSQEDMVLTGYLSITLECAYVHIETGAGATASPAVHDEFEHIRYLLSEAIASVGRIYKLNAHD